MSGGTSTKETKVQVEGVLITPQQVMAVKARGRIGELLREKGVTLDELIESGRRERTALVEEIYGIPRDKQGE